MCSIIYYKTACYILLIIISYEYGQNICKIYLTYLSSNGLWSVFISLSQLMVYFLTILLTLTTTNIKGNKTQKTSKILAKILVPITEAELKINRTELNAAALKSF